MRMHNPPHPGEILNEMWLKPMGLTITEAAAWLQFSRKTLSEILNGRATVALETAVRFELATGKSAQSWLGHQAAYDDWHADKLRKSLSVRAWDAAVMHRAAMVVVFEGFMCSNGLRALWYQGDKLLRMQSVRGGTQPAPIVVNFRVDYWAAYDALGESVQKEARAIVLSNVEVSYKPDCMAQYAQEVTADAASLMAELD